LSRFQKKCPGVPRTFFFGGGTPKCPSYWFDILYIRITALMQDVHVPVFHRWQATSVFVVSGFVQVLMVGQAFATFFSLWHLQFVIVPLTQDVPFRNLQLPRGLKKTPAVAEVVGHSHGCCMPPRHAVSSSLDLCSQYNEPLCQHV
jgi:hypothetical protein